MRYLFMWTIISTSKNLKFYCFNEQVFKSYEHIEFSVKDGYPTIDEVDDHNVVVSKLLSMGHSIFINKKDASQQVVSKKLTGVKYLKLNPTIISL